MEQWTTSQQIHKRTQVFHLQQSKGKLEEEQFKAKIKGKRRGSREYLFLSIAKKHTSTNTCVRELILHYRQLAEIHRSTVKHDPYSPGSNTKQKQHLSYPNNQTSIASVLIQQQQRTTQHLFLSNYRNQTTQHLCLILIDWTQTGNFRDGASEPSRMHKFRTCAYHKAHWLIPDVTQCHNMF